MAIELTTRTKILAGVVVLAAAGAGAWFFYLQDLFDEPAPVKVAAPASPAAKPASSVPKPAADAPKADAPKAAAALPAVEAPKQADAPKMAEAAKPAAGAAPEAKAAAKPAAAKPIPTNPEQLIAELIEASGIKSQFQSFSRETLLKAGSSEQAKRSAADPEQVKAVNEMLERAFEPGRMNAQLAASLKGGFNAERMTRFLELLRQPIVVRMNAPELRNIPPEVMAEHSENFRKSPPPASRVKLVQTLDDVTHTSELAIELANAIARTMVDTMLAELQKAGKNVPREARRSVGAQLNAMRSQAHGQIRTTLYIMYRNATDQELAEYAKLLDTDTGRRGWEQLANAARPMLVERGGTLGREVARLALAKRMEAMAKAPAAPAPEAQPKAQAAPAEKPAAAAAPAPPAGPAGYRRPANVKPLYSRYNDLVTATVMRDRAAVKELLDDGKRPNVRQSDGMTPLMIAASNADTEIAGMLLAKGADPNLRAGGKTALALARARGAAGAPLVALLQRSGAKD